MKRIILWVVAAALVVGGVISAVGYRKAHAAPAYTFQTEPASKHHIVGKITATGTLLATVTVTVGRRCLDACRRSWRTTTHP